MYDKWVPSDILLKLMAGVEDGTEIKTADRQDWPGEFANCLCKQTQMKVSSPS